MWIEYDKNLALSECQKLHFQHELRNGRFVCCFSFKNSLSRSIFARVFQ